MTNAILGMMIDGSIGFWGPVLHDEQDWRSSKIVTAV